MYGFMDSYIVINMYVFIYTYISDCTNWIMGKHSQQRPLLCILQLPTGLECVPFPDRWWVEALFCTGQNQEQETGSIKGEDERDCYDSFGVGLLPRFFSKSSACLSYNWVVTCLLFQALYHHSKSLLLWDKNQGWEINQLDG